MTSLLKMQVEDLENVKRHLDAQSLGFAQSLIDQFLRRGLSEKQAAWVPKLIERAEKARDHVQPERTNIGSVKGVVELLERAAQHLQYPAVLALANDVSFRINIAGERARFPGSLNVCTLDNGGREWVGRVHRDGSWEPSRAIEGSATATAIGAALTALATDPEQAARRYGRLTGICCFCGTGLENERSTAVGYGPVCAKHFGLRYPTMSEALAMHEADAA